MNWPLVPPQAYRETWGPEADADVRERLKYHMSQAAAVYQAMPDDCDPRSLEAIRLESYVRQLMECFLAYQPPQGVAPLNDHGRAEIIMCALTNVMGGWMMKGVTGESDALRRIDAVAERFILYALDEFRKNAGDGSGATP